MSLCVHGVDPDVLVYQPRRGVCVRLVVVVLRDEAPGVGSRVVLMCVMRLKKDSWSLLT